MAFSRKSLNLATGSSGVAGVIVYTSATDALATIKGNGYWSSDLADAGDMRARGAAESFVEDQRVAATRGVPICMLSGAAAGGGMEWDEAYLHTDGRIRIRGGEYNIT